VTALAEVLLPVMLIPTSVLESEPFQILATFVALNSLIYATLAVLKVIPKGYALFRFNGQNRRRQNRSIYPEQMAPPSVGSDPLPAPLTADSQVADLAEPVPAEAGSGNAAAAVQPAVDRVASTGPPHPTTARIPAVSTPSPQPWRSPEKET